MSITEFAEAVKKELETRTGEEVEIANYQKNNGVMLRGLVIKDMQSNIVPTIYLESFYEKYIHDEDMDYVVDNILDIYKESRVEGYRDMSFFCDFNKVKDKIAFKLINFNDNKEILKKVPYIKFLDLAKVYYVNVELEDFGAGTVLVHNTHMIEWGVSVEELEKHAAENTPKLSPLQMIDLWDIAEQLEEEISEDLRDSVPEVRKENKSYVMTNQQKIFGAATMLYKDVIKNHAEKLQCDIYILPSSIHDLILIPADFDMNVEYMKYMVRDVNRTQVLREEVLSDSVYIYHRETDCISIA